MVPASNGGIMNFKKAALGLLATAVLASCNNSSSSASTPAPDVQTKGCIKESDLMKAGIVGGEKVSNYDVDSKKVVLLFAEDDEENMSICTSTPIAPNVLLTAAHCLSKKHFVVFNSSISCESGFNSEKHIGQVRFAFKHESWDEDADTESNSANDVAIVILEENIPSSYRVSKIARPSDVDFESGSVRFIGYGVTDYKAGGSGILRKTEITIDKAKVDSGRNLVRIDQSGGQGVCSGDSGGPSLVKVNGEERILGVNSVVGGSSKEKMCRQMAIQSLAAGHISWIETKLSMYNIDIKL